MAGSFTMEVVRRTGCKVTSLTLSTEEKVLAEKRVAAVEMEDKINVLMCNYQVIKALREFDTVVSIEMLGAVGTKHLEIYFETINRLLKPDREGGIGIFQYISMSGAVSTHPNKNCRWI